MRCFSLIVTLRLRLFRYPAPRAPHFSAQTLIVRDALRTSRRVRLQVLAQPRRAGARPTLAPFKPSGAALRGAAVTPDGGAHLSCPGP